MTLPFTRPAVAAAPDGTWTPGGGESVPADEPATGDTPPWNDLPKCLDGEQLYNLLSNFAHDVNEGWEPDWENPLERKYYKCRIYLNNSWQFLNVIYFKSKELAQRAVDEVVVPFEKGEL